MTDYISRQTAISMFAELQELANKRVCDTPTDSPGYMRYVTQARERDDTVRRLMDLPAADVVPWEWLERYAAEKRLTLASVFVAQAREIYEERIHCGYARGERDD